MILCCSWYNKQLHSSGSRHFAKKPASLLTSCRKEPEAAQLSQQQPRNPGRHPHWPCSLHTAMAQFLHSHRTTQPSGNLPGSVQKPDSAIHGGSKVPLFTSIRNWLCIYESSTSFFFLRARKYYIYYICVCYICSIENTIIRKAEEVHSSVGADLYFLAGSVFLMDHIAERTACWFHPSVQSELLRQSLSNLLALFILCSSLKYILISHMYRNGGTYNVRLCQWMSIVASCEVLLC